MRSASRSALSLAREYWLLLSELLLQAVQKLYTALQAGPRAVDQCGRHVQDVRLALRNLRASVGDVVALDLDALYD